MDRGSATSSGGVRRGGRRFRRGFGGGSASRADDGGGVAVATRRRMDEQPLRPAARGRGLVPARLRGLDGHPRGWPLVGRHNGVARGAHPGAGSRLTGGSHGGDRLRFSRRSESGQQPAGRIRLRRRRPQRRTERSQCPRRGRRYHHRRGSRAQLDAGRFSRHAPVVRAPAPAWPGGVNVELHPDRADRDARHDPCGARRRAVAGSTEGNRS